MAQKRQSRIGEVRCQNCATRFRPQPGTQRETCPECGIEWYISWKGDLAKIRKPVWESWEQHITKAQRDEE